MRVNNINGFLPYIKRDNKNRNQAQNNFTFKAVPQQYEKALLVILDGFGVQKGGELNPFKKSRMPFYKSLLANIWGDTLVRNIEASGVHVGLPANLVGSSEVGHNNIGAGRLIPQDLMVIDRAIEDGTFLKLKSVVKNVI